MSDPPSSRGTKSSPASRASVPPEAAGPADTQEREGLVGGDVTNVYDTLESETAPPDVLLPATEVPLPPPEPPAAPASAERTDTSIDTEALELPPPGVDDPSGSPLPGFHHTRSMGFLWNRAELGGGDTSGAESASVPSRTPEEQAADEASGSMSAVEISGEHSVIG